MKKVSILLPVYNPNQTFLKKQLISLNNQTYKNIEVLIYDDCPKKRCNKEIFKKYLKNVKYKVLAYKNENIGYSLAFKALIDKVNHDGYVAFCDQDDIWCNEKIEVMVNKLEQEQKSLAFCDMKIIDENDNIMSEGEVNPIVKDFKVNYYKLLTGSPFRTLAQGMSIICEANFAKNAGNYKEFKKYSFDQLICCCALANKSYIHIHKDLVKYRRHSNNVSGFLSDVKSKKDYYNKRIKIQYDMTKYIYNKYPNININEALEYATARLNKNIFKMYKYRWINKKKTYLEILLLLTPNKLSEYIIKIIKKHR